MYSNQGLKYAILILFLSSMMFIIMKPRFFFNNQGHPYEFGVRENETIVPYYSVSFILSILVYIIILIGN
jgi:hypothetical protein